MAGRGTLANKARGATRTRVGKTRFSRPAVVVSCTDLDRSTRFYCDVLGAVPDPEAEWGACPWFLLGGLRISLMPNAAEPADTTPKHAMLSLWLEVDDLGRAHRAFSKAGVTILQEPDDATLMIIADPDGIVIEVWQRDTDDGPA
jgi:catechol 2,3-dioxygenase-like lactoylglutathione lyase family enzyme